MTDVVFLILNSNLFSTPWSIYLDGELVRGKKFSLPKICNDCSELECLKEEAKAICSKGMESKKDFVGGRHLVIPGVKSDSKNRKEKTQSITDQSYRQWVNEVKSLVANLDQEALNIKSETLHYFHDPVKWAEQIKINSEKMIDSRSGANFREKFSSASNEVKSVYQSAKLLVDSIQMIDIFFNPESATYGSTVKTNIYRLFDKVQAILFHSEGKKYNKRFKMVGTSYKEIHLYESFPIIALSLTHNALKYSKTREIEIFIEDSASNVDVEVISVGPGISEIEKPRIFEKGYRGKAANVIHHDGSGIGLYVAQHIAGIHGFKINVDSEDLGYSDGGIAMAKNTFSFKVPARGV
ncbi:sensor histidine kinase [Halopseudomonas oceani]|uniref:sensor histidine kinase n=1 Tax=Halopseudomonas oceani TaxID=1708783 RepID=UPI002AA8DC0E|nr:sensor histidine kinase [Halopseudomonas oceani]